MLIDAILGMFLLGSFYIADTYLEKERQNEQVAAALGKDMAEVVHAIDKRLVLDGRELSSFDTSTRKVVLGDWNDSWPTNSDYVSMLTEELVAPFNNECGLGSSGKWVPKLAVNDSAKLVKCSVASLDSIPFGFRVESERTSIDSADHMLSRWTITLWQPTKTGFESYFKYYPSILETFGSHDVLQMAGAHRAYYVNRTTDQQIKQGSSCFISGTSCGLRFEIDLSQSEFDQGDTELRLDRAIMLDDFTFRVSAVEPEKCFKPNKDNPSMFEEVHCGFDFDIESGQLNLNVHEMTASNFELMYEDLANQAPVVTLCTAANDKDKLEVKPCGMSVMKGSSSTLASMYVDQVFADQLKVENLETDGDIIIRKSWDKSDSLKFNNRLEISIDKLVRLEPSKDDRLVELGEHGIKIEAKNSTIATLSDNSIIGENDLGNSPVTEKLNLDAPNVRLALSGGTANLVTSAKQTKNMHSRYDSGTDSPLATEAFIQQGVNIVSIEEVPSGGSVKIKEKRCATGSGSAKPSIKVTVFPAKGFNTDIMSSKFDHGRCSPTGRNNGTGVSAVKYRESRGRDWFAGTFSMRCEMNRNMNVRYDYRRARGYIYPRFFFDVQGKSGAGGRNYDQISGVPMTVIQFCDYSKS